MQTHIHQDLAGWIDASASNALTAEERDRLGRHLANCPRCYGNTADLAILESVLVTLEGRDCFDPGLESRLVQDFRDRNRRAGAATRFALTRKTAVRLTVVTLTAVLLVTRWLGVDLLRPAAETWSALGALRHGIVRSPTYPAGIVGRGNILGDHEELLATVHELMSLYAEAFLLVGFSLVLGLVVLDTFRRHWRLRPCH